MPTNRASEFPAVFGRLRSIIEPYARELHVTDDSNVGYGVDTAPEGQRDPTTWFAGVRLGKAYVSYYLMPVYVDPSLLDGVSPELRRRMQGKSCFNFRSVDEGLFAELTELTRRGYERATSDPRWSETRHAAHDATHRRPKSEAKATSKAGSA